jgi:transglutaminase-like putative cysteine protease
VHDLVDSIGPWFLDTTAGGAAVRVDQAEVGRWPLLLPRGASAVTAETPYLERDRFGLLRRPPGLALTMYGALLPAKPRRAGGNPAQVAVAGAQVGGASDLQEDRIGGHPQDDRVGARLSEDEREESLAPPPRVDPRLVDLARALALQGNDPRERVAATVRHLRSGYQYTLDPGLFRTSDPLAEFLFEKKAGYCEYFASAAVILLRLQGVPARFVKGLNVGPEADVGGGLHVVRESDAHAWIEAFVPGEGWIEEDPTPPDQLASARPPAGTIERLFERARAALTAAWNRITATRPTVFFAWFGRRIGALAREPVAWLVVLALAFGPRLVRVLRALRLRRRKPAGEPVPETPAELRALVQDVERLWAAAGRPRPAARGMLEHARALGVADGPSAPIPEALRAAGLDVVDAYYRARFGGQALDPTETSRLRAALPAGRAISRTPATPGA